MAVTTTRHIVSSEEWLEIATGSPRVSLMTDGRAVLVHVGGSAPDLASADWVVLRPGASNALNFSELSSADNVYARSQDGGSASVVAFMEA